VLRRDVRRSVQDCSQNFPAAGRHEAASRMGRPSRSGQTTPSVFEHGLDLLARHAGKPRETIIHTSAIFEVFEQCFYGYARALEHPDAADFSGHPLDRWTVAPIKHDPSIRPVTSHGKPYVVAGGGQVGEGK
jgi:hypothetical protein